MKEVLSNELKPMKKVFEEYYKCSSCDSTYHITMLDKPEILCKDCNKSSLVPSEAKEKSKKLKR